MERQAHNSLNEAALQVQLGEDFGFDMESKKSAKKRKAKEKAKASETETVGFGFGAKEVPIKRSRITGRRIRKKKEKIRIVSTDWPHDAGMDIHDGVEEEVLEYFKNYFGDNLNEDTSDEDIMEAVYDLVDLTEAVCEAISSAEKLERSKYRQGEDEAKANKDYNNPKNPQRYKRRRKVTKARQEKETRKANKDYYNTTGTSDDAKERSKKLFRIRDMSSLRRGYQAHSWK